MNELTVTKNTLPVKSVSELIEIGRVLDQSCMFGGKPGQGTVVAVTCYQEGITYLKFLETYHIVANKPSMKAEKMLSNLLKLGGKYKVIRRDSEMATGEFEYKDAKIIGSMTIAEAKKEKYYYCADGKTPKDNWATPRKCMQMLWNRVVSDSVSVVCPEAHEFYTAEENQEFETVDIDKLPVIIDQTPPPIKDQPKPEVIVTATAQTIAEGTEKKIEKPLEVVTGEAINFTLMPVGNDKGKPFSFFPIEILEKVRNNKKLKSVLPEHIAEIDKVIAAKQAEKAALAKADDARAESGAVNA
ncbi:MAG: hypothetical protein WC373_05180 [Smithella sp.]|jgi:hypothetical protein